MEKYMVCCVALTALITGTGNGNAELLDKLSVHGAGSWAAGMTDNENRYFLWTEDSNLEHLETALGIRAEVYDTVSVSVQASFDRTWVGTDVKVDYAFAEWSFSKQLIFRGGQVNVPFMFYSDIYDVGTALPFFNLPSGIYQGAGVEAYKGVGVTGIVSFSGDWTVQCDIYGGKMIQQTDRKFSNYDYSSIDDEGNVVSDGGWYLEIPDQAAEEMIGGRIMVTPPLAGLRFALSAYTGDQQYYESGSLNEYEDYWNETLFNTLEKPIFAGFSIEYLFDAWELRSEYLMTYQDAPRYQATKIYAEVAYRFTERWQAAVRYEYNTVNELPDQGFPYDFDALREHKELVFGLNYWLTPRLAVKGSYHMVQGNRFAGPADDEQCKDGLWSGSFDEEDTQLFLFGVQFSF